MNEQHLTHISKVLSYYLRHYPDKVGLTLEPGGWVAVDDLLAGLQRTGQAVSRSELEEVVAHNTKQRFAFDADGTHMRANQGHSVAVDLELEPLMPPDILYHGTSQRAVTAIIREGLRKMSRHHVHLSRDTATARTVGSRHGSPVVFAVDAAAMYGAGHQFFCTANGVWLVDAVPAAFLRQLSPHEQNQA